jgi:hypothetical protein
MLFSVKKKFPMNNEVRNVLYRDARISSFVAKVLGEVFTRFHPVSVKRHSSMIDCLAFQGKFFVSNFRDVK